MAQKPKKKQLSEDEFESELLRIETDKSKHNLPEPAADEKESEMKISNTKKIVLTTIATTVFVLIVLAATFYAGTRYEADRNATIKGEAVKLVEQLKHQSK